MGMHLNGQLVITDDLLVAGDIKQLGGGKIRTVDNNDLTLLPHGTGITVIGDAGSPGNLGTPTNDDAYVAGRLEVDGHLYADNYVSFANSAFVAYNRSFQFGSSTDFHILLSTAQTPYVATLGVSTGSRMLIVCEQADRATNWGYSQRTDPTVIIQSADATTPAQRLELSHNQTNGIIECLTGDLVLTLPANKTLALSRTVWDDLKVPLERGRLGSGNQPTFAQFMDDGASSVGVFAYAFADQAVAGNEEQLFFSVQLPHSYKQGTDIGAHIHWSPAVSGGANEFVKWGLEYTWVNVDGTFGNTTIITSDASSASTATTSGDTTLTADKHYITVIGTITGTGKNISSMLMCRVFRNSSHADDDLAQDAFGLDFDFHYEIDTMGSRQNYVK